MPERTERRWPDPDSGPWLLTLLWQRHDGRPEVAGLHLTPLDPANRAVVTTSLLRDLRLAELAAEERMKLAHEPAPPKDPEVVLAGMRPATARRLALAAEIYREAWSRGAAPRKEVAARLNVTPAAAANLITRARSVGLLPPTSAGVPSG